MVLWDPAFVIRASSGGRGDGANKADLVGVGALSLGDDSGEPSVVDEIGRGTKAGCKEKV